MEGIMLKDKHYAMLGSLVKKYVGLDEDKRFNNVSVGQAVEEFYKIVEGEAMRDARDEANGKNILDNVKN
jgi:hypothetical protein